MGAKSLSINTLTSLYNLLTSAIQAAWIDRRKDLSIPLLNVISLRNFLSFCLRNAASSHAFKKLSRFQSLVHKLCCLEG